MQKGIFFPKELKSSNDFVSMFFKCFRQTVLRQEIQEQIKAVAFNYLTVPVFRQSVLRPFFPDRFDISRQNRFAGVPVAKLGHSLSRRKNCNDLGSPGSGTLT